MAAYRFYSLDPDGHISGPPTVVEFPDDSAAIEAAEALVNGKAIEVWELARIVIRLEPKHT